MSALLLIPAIPLYLWWEWRRFLARQVLADQLLTWENNWRYARTALADFPDAVDALDYLRGAADGEHVMIEKVRNNIRARRAADPLRDWIPIEIGHGPRIKGTITPAAEHLEREADVNVNGLPRACYVSYSAKRLIARPVEEWNEGEGLVQTTSGTLNILSAFKLTPNEPFGAADPKN